jgi:hypothetical protein
VNRGIAIPGTFGAIKGWRLSAAIRVDWNALTSPEMYSAQCETTPTKITLLNAFQVDVFAI